MDLWRRAADPWGQDVLIGVSWDLMYAAIIVAVAFLVGHAVWIKTRPAEAPAEVGDAPAGIPERIPRHSMAARVFHWTMSSSMLVLLVTAFVPVLGLQFKWVEIHWIAGVVLTATIVYHIIHSIGWQDFWSMFQIGFSEGIAHFKHIMSPKSPEPKAGKYPFDHRLYHHALVVVGLGVIATGLLMMVRIDTPFWTRNPYMLADSTWGVVYVLHGLCGVVLIFLTASHIYFALRPEKRWITWSMVRGWVDREHYLEHHDPAKWVVTNGAGAPPSVTEGTPPAETGAVEDASLKTRSAAE